MADDLISVIVPVYKVEKYLEKCVTSILRQTYRELEIILVDDGSPDNCGRICDDYAKKDSRIKVIHKKNGGQASARNAGLDICRGDYIAFVDSDDWIDDNMLEKLHETIVAEHSDIAECSFVIETDGKTKEREYHISDCTLSREEALKALIEDKVVNSFVWNNLYKQALFDQIRFPEGKIFEDILVMHKLFELSDSVSVIDLPCYHYLKRDGSTVDVYYCLLTLDALEAFKQRYLDLKDKYPQWRSIMMARYQREYLSRLSLLSKRCDMCYRDVPQLEEYRKFNLLHFKWKDFGYSLNPRQAIVTIISFLPPRFIIWLYRMVHFIRQE